jgi:receptor expression-enhancing protein 5/6
VNQKTKNKNKKTKETKENTMSTTAIETTLHNVRTQILKYPVLKKYALMLEDQTGWNSENYVLVLAGLLALALFSGVGAHFVANMIGFLYPLYATIRALETHTKEDDTEWLTYWVVFATFSCLENFVEFVLYWIPFYYPVKATFLLWCMLPQYKGASKVYEMVVKPVVLKHESVIDAALNNVDPKAVLEGKTKAT